MKGIVLTSRSTDWLVVAWGWLVVWLDTGSWPMVVRIDDRVVSVGNDGEVTACD